MLEMLQSGGLPIDKPHFLKLISSTKGIVQRDQLYDVLSYSRSFHYGLSPQSVKTLSLPIVERLLSTAYILEYTEMSILLARELLRREDESKRYHFAQCILALAPCHSSELVNFIDKDTVTSYIASMRIENDIDTQVLSNIFSLWIQSNDTESIASALELVLEQDLSFIPLLPHIMTMTMDCLRHSAHADQAQHFITLNWHRLRSLLSDNTNDSALVSHLVKLLHVLCADPTQDAIVTDILGRLHPPTHTTYVYLYLFMFLCIQPPTCLCTSVFLPRGYLAIDVTVEAT